MLGSVSKSIFKKLGEVGEGVRVVLQGESLVSLRDLLVEVILLDVHRVLESDLVGLVVLPHDGGFNALATIKENIFRT